MFASRTALESPRDAVSKMANEVIAPRAAAAVSPFFGVNEVKALIATDSREALVAANLAALDAGVQLIGMEIEDRVALDTGC